MKAIVYRKYGPPDVLRLEDVEKPVPKEDEVLIKVHCTTVSPLDWHLRSGKPFLARIMAGGPRKPKITILGFDVSGEIESTGKNAPRFKTGDPVYGMVPPGANGANAEYVCVPQDNVLLKPADLTYEEAATVPLASGIALRFLKLGGIQSGQRVLINGASGGLGTYGVQLAKHFGAEVTAVCGAANVGMVSSLGADEVIDYTKEDFTKRGRTYDLIFDAAGKSSFPGCRRSLDKNGTYISTAASFQIIFFMLATSVAGGKKAKFAVAKVGPDDLKFINSLIGSGKLRAVIDSRYPLEQVAEAHRHAETGHLKGRIVVKVGG